DTTHAMTAVPVTLTVTTAGGPTFTVTPSVGTASGTISPNTPQTITSGATTNFTLAPAAGYAIDSVGGTCGGSLAGNVFTTTAVTANCTVVANFKVDGQPVFPAPYCSVNFTSSVEPITRVIGMGIDNPSSAA